MFKLEVNLIGCLILIGATLVVGSLIFKEHQEKEELIDEVISLREKMCEN